MKRFGPRERLYIVPTGHGLAWLGISIMMVLAGASAGNNLVFICAFALLALFMLIMIMTHNNLKGLKVELVASEDSFAGENARLRVRLINESGRERLGIRLDAAKRRLRAGMTEAHVAPNSSQTEALTWRPSGRGVHSVPIIRVATVFPMGLFYTWKYLEAEAQAFVYPKAEGNVQIPQPIGFGEQGPRGRAHSDSEPTDFREHRGYQRGEPFARVDWKLFARSGQMMTKKFEDQIPQKYLLRWQDVMALGDEKALSQLTEWIERLRRHEQDFELILPHRHLARGRGPMHARECLRALATYKAGAA